MKISKFSDKHQISIDTIRYYMEIGLIVPLKKGKHYDFDDSCSNDLEEIKSLKDIGFSLSEIGRLFSFRRLTLLKSETDKEYYKEFYLKQKENIINEIEILNDKIYKIDNEIKKINLKDDNLIKKLGVPIYFFSHFSCPRCKSTLSLKSGVIEDNMVFDGQMDCTCGYKVKIKDGIVIVNDLDNTNSQMYNDNFLQEYSKTTHKDFINYLFNIIHWNMENIDWQSMQNQIIMELGTGVGVFISYMNNLIPCNNYYICIDKDYNSLKILKKKLEKNPKLQYIFICSDFLEIPVKNNIIDLIVDLGGSMNFNRSNKQFLFKLLYDILKTKGKWLGVYYYFEPYSRSLLMYGNYRDNYLFQNILQGFKQNGYKEIYLKKHGYIDKLGEYEKFFEEGDKVYYFSYYGEKMLD